MLCIDFIVLVGFLGVSLYYASLVILSHYHQEPNGFSTAPISVGQLKINNLVASADGTVSLDVTLYNCDSGIVEAVIINGTSYLWSEGCLDNGTILKGQTKSWSKNIGSLNLGDKIEVTLQATSNKTSETVTVSQPSIPVSPDVPDKPEIPYLPSYFYDFYSGVGLFDRGVFFIATSEDPLTQLPRSDLPESYWNLMRDNVTNLATDQDFISILISRGDFPTAGFDLQVEAFSWLDSSIVKFRFQVNFTDPGEEVAVAQVLTSPLVLVPIGGLSPGEYKVEVYIVSYILTFDEQGNPHYQPIMTFKEEVWTQTLTITQNPKPSTTFKVTVNSNPFPDLTTQVDLSFGVTREKAREIADATFIHVKGEKTLFRLDDLIFNDKQIFSRYTWGVNEEDTGHIFELEADLMTRQITVNHCF